MKTRLIRNLRKLHRGNVPFLDHDLPKIESPGEAVLRTPVGFIKRSHLVSTLSCFICLEMALLWSGVTPRQTVLNVNYPAVKVGLIMKMYHCQDERIYQAVMDTFNPVLVATVIGIESEFQIDAVSRVGCRGLMQLTPNKLADWKDPVANIQVGAAYLESLIKRFGRIDLAIAAYNAGPAAIIKYGGIPPYRETQKHLDKAKIIGLKTCWPFSNPLITGLHFSFNG